MANPQGINQYTKGGRSKAVLRANSVKRSDRVHELMSAKPHPLVHDVIKRFPVMGDMKKHLASLSGDKLRTAYKLTTGSKDVGSKYVRDTIKATLKSRK